MEGGSRKGEKWDSLALGPTGGVAEKVGRDSDAKPRRARLKRGREMEAIESLPRKGKKRGGVKPTGCR